MIEAVRCYRAGKNSVAQRHSQKEHGRSFTNVGLNAPRAARVRIDSEAICLAEVDHRGVINARDLGRRGKGYQQYRSIEAPLSDRLNIDIREARGKRTVRLKLHSVISATRHYAAVTEHERCGALA